MARLQGMESGVGDRDWGTKVIPQSFMVTYSWDSSFHLINLYYVPSSARHPSSLLLPAFLEIMIQREDRH